MKFYFHNRWKNSTLGMWHYKLESELSLKIFEVYVLIITIDLWGYFEITLFNFGLAVVMPWY